MAYTHRKYELDCNTEDEHLLRLVNVLDRDIDEIFKVLCIFQYNIEGLPLYLDSLIIELVGCQKSFTELSTSDLYQRIISTMNYIRDNIDEFELAGIKREVFKCIDIIHKLLRIQGATPVKESK